MILRRGKWEESHNIYNLLLCMREWTRQLAADMDTKLSFNRNITHENFWLIRFANIHSFSLANITDDGHKIFVLHIFQKFFHLFLVNNCYLERCGSYLMMVCRCPLEFKNMFPLKIVLCRQWKTESDIIGTGCVCIRTADMLVILNHCLQMINNRLNLVLIAIIGSVPEESIKYRNIFYLQFETLK